MASPATTTAPLYGPSATTVFYPRMPASVWRAPLVGAALAVTVGIVLDRQLGVPLGASAALVFACLVAWLCCHLGRLRGLPLVYLALAGAAFGACYHHYRRDVHAANDIGLLATTSPRLMQVRGFLDEEPSFHPALPPGPLRIGRPDDGSTMAILSLSHFHGPGGWVPAAGRVRLSGKGRWPELHCGDEVEVMGQLTALPAPANPGEPDWGGFLRDRGITARLTVRHTPSAAQRLASGWSWHRILAVVRRWGRERFQRSLSENTSGLATALLLGDSTALSPRDWLRYQRTGVIHVLAISGQHLVVLACFLWLLLPRLGIRQRQAAWIVALVLLSYALLTGGRPPVMRSAVTVCAACGALILRRLVLPANLLALAWLVVALLNPMDLFSAGCQLSFLSVAILYWGVRHVVAQPDDPLRQVIERSRPVWQRNLLRLVRRTGELFTINGLIWLGITPLAAANFHTIPIAGLWLGPFIVLVTDIALFLGFALLLGAPVGLPLQGSLQLCDWLVCFGEARRGSYVYVGDIPAWWLAGFYLGLLAVLTQQPLWQRRGWAVSAGLGWLALGLLLTLPRPREELRCTFLAVGHGGCTVLELPDGRTLLYDAGSLAGPEVTARQIAPFLWHRGIRHIDEVILSHADLDHFNGLVDLLDCFSVGQVTCTPTFSDKPIDGVSCTLAELQRRRVPVRIVKAGDRLQGGEVVLEVLHPPPHGPDGNENARSLVLQVEHAGHVLLLTGDLEGNGLKRVLQMPAPRLDVLMAPHHGSGRSNTRALARWARAPVVISSQERPRGGARLPDPYSGAGAYLLRTGVDGAVAIRSRKGELVVETFVTKRRFLIPSTTDAARP